MLRPFNVPALSGRCKSVRSERLRPSAAAASQPVVVFEPERCVRGHYPVVIASMQPKSRCACDLESCDRSLGESVRRPGDHKAIVEEAGGGRRTGSS